MKMFGFLLAAVLLCGCSARPPQPLLVNALTDGLSHAGVSHFVTPAKGQAEDRDFGKLKDNLETALRGAGLHVVKDFGESDAALFVLYSFDHTTVQAAVQVPVYGTIGSTSQSALYENTVTGRTSVHTTTYLTRGIKGYRKQNKDVIVYRATLVLSAVSRRTGEELWRTVAACVVDEPDRSKALAVLLQASAGYFDKNTSGFVQLQQEDSGGVPRLVEIRD